MAQSLIRALASRNVSAMTDKARTDEKAYKAFAFHPQFGGRTLAGKLVVTREHVRFSSESANAEFPVDGLSIRAGGHNGEQIFLTHPSLPDWSLYTSDRSFLADGVLKEITALSNQLRTIERSERRPRSKLLMAFAGLVLFFAASVLLVFAQKDRLVRLLAAQVPMAWEQNLGDQLFRQIQSQDRIVKDFALERRVRQVTERLAPAAAQSGYVFQFHIVSDTNINAFAMPGGHIIVHTGLLDAVATPSELAGVLAHEMAHITQRHGFRKIIESAGLYLIVQWFLGDASGLLAVIADSSQFLLRQKYSRDFESEADDLGWDYLLAARINPRGMIDFFSKLKSHEERMAQIPDFLSTHPTTDRRIERLEQKWKRLNPESGFIDFAKQP